MIHVQGSQALPTPREDERREVKKKNDNFTKRARRAQGSGDILPAGGARDTAQCPHAPVTLHCNTCGGCRDALPGHYLCCSRETNVTTPFCTGHGGGHQSRRAGGASLCRGTPALRHARARAAILLHCLIKGNHRMISQISHPVHPPGCAP